MSTSKYTPTGFPRGRPRRGETRPVSENAVKCAEWRKNNIAAWTEYNREYQAKWRAENRDRSNEISRNTYRRRKLWEANDGC